LLHVLTKRGRNIATRVNNREAVPMLLLLTRRGRTIATRVKNSEAVQFLHVLTTERLYNCYTC